ncbi:MAG: CBS domain-containing protein [Lachnospiraceae bacterium]|nr:CBS domain-containing protein [Lachnospiraceae bacterium]
MNILFFLTPKSEVAYVSTDSTLQETLDIMEQYRYSVVPMIDREGRYSGIITEGDLLYNMKNSFSCSIEQISRTPISLLDTRRNYSPVSIDATLEEVFKKSMQQNFVPVVDDDNIFIGLVKRRDIIQYFYNKYIHEK